MRIFLAVWFVLVSFTANPAPRLDNPHGVSIPSVDYFKQQLAGNHDNPVLLYFLGSAQINAGLLGDAVVSLKKAVPYYATYCDPRPQTLLVAIMNELACSSDPATARHIFDDALALVGDDTFALDEKTALLVNICIAKTQLADPTKESDKQALAAINLQLAQSVDSQTAYLRIPFAVDPDDVLIYAYEKMTGQHKDADEAAGSQGAHPGEPAVPITSTPIPEIPVGSIQAGPNTSTLGAVPQEANKTLTGKWVLSGAEGRIAKLNGVEINLTQSQAELTGTGDFEEVFKGTYLNGDVRLVISGRIPQDKPKSDTQGYIDTFTMNARYTFLGKADDKQETIEGTINQEILVYITYSEPWKEKWKEACKLMNIREIPDSHWTFIKSTPKISRFMLKRVQ